MAPLIYSIQGFSTHLEDDILFLGEVMPAHH